MRDPLDYIIEELGAMAAGLESSTKSLPAGRRRSVRNGSARRGSQKMLLKFELLPAKGDMYEISAYFVDGTHLRSEIPYTGLHAFANKSITVALERERSKKKRGGLHLPSGRKN